MGRHSNSLALTSGPPPPLDGAAGKLQSRRANSPSRTKQIAQPVKPVASKISGVLSGASPQTSNRSSQRGGSPSRSIAGKPTPGREMAVATGVAHVPGKKQSKPGAITGAKSSGKKQFAAAAGTLSSIDSVVFGADVDGSASAIDPRNFDGAAGTPTNAAEHAGIFAEVHAPHPAAAYGARSSADSLIFNRDIDHSAGVADPHAAAWHGAAGARSEASALAPYMTLPQHGADRVGFEDIPHSKFANSPGVKRVDGGAAARTQAQQHMYSHHQGQQQQQQQQPMSWPGATAGQQQQMQMQMQMQAMQLHGGRGAAGATTDWTDARHQRDLAPNRAKINPADAQRLYAGGAGVRTEAGSDTTAWNQLHDVSVRTAARPTDQQMQAGADPRDFSRSAGARSATVGQKVMGSHDITRAPHLGSGAVDMHGRVGLSSSHMAAQPQGVRSAQAILEGDDATAPYESDEYAGVKSSWMGAGEPGQRKWTIGTGEVGDYVGVRPVSDISDMVWKGEDQFPSAG